MDEGFSVCDRSETRSPSLLLYVNNNSYFSPFLTNHPSTVTVKRAKRWLNGARSIRWFLDQRRWEWGFISSPVSAFSYSFCGRPPPVPRAECCSCGFLSKIQKPNEKVLPARFQRFSNFTSIKLRFHYSIQHHTTTVSHTVIHISFSLPPVPSTLHSFLLPFSCSQLVTLCPTN